MLTIFWCLNARVNYQKHPLRASSKHAALEMFIYAIDYVDSESVFAPDMNWHNVIGQSVEVKCRLQLKADRCKVSLFAP